MTIAEMFSIGWAITMTVLWQLSNAKFKKVLLFSYRAASLAADGKGKFVRRDNGEVQFVGNDNG